MKRCRFTIRDHDLYPILKKANTNELMTLSKVINEGWSSNISKSCTNPYEIARELQFKGGHSALNLWRGHGVYYKEIALDAAKKVGAKVCDLDSIEKVEWALLTKLMRDAEEKMSHEDKEKLFAEISEKSGDNAISYSDIFSPLLISNPYLYTIVLDTMLPYIFRLIGLEAAAIFLGGRLATIAIPIIGWGVAIGSVAYAIGDTSYKVTIPCVAIIGSIRVRLKSEENSEYLGA